MHQGKNCIAYYTGPIYPCNILLTPPILWVMFADSLITIMSYYWPNQAFCSFIRESFPLATTTNGSLTGRIKLIGSISTVSNPNWHLNLLIFRVLWKITETLFNVKNTMFILSILMHFKFKLIYFPVAAWQEARTLAEAVEETSDALLRHSQTGDPSTYSSPRLDIPTHL